MKKGYKFTEYDYSVRNWTSRKDKANIKENGKVRRLSEKTVKKIKTEKFNNTCAICGLQDPDVVDLHHIEEVCKGGTNHLDNLICLCANHHRKTHSYMKLCKVA